MVDVPLSTQLETLLIPARSVELLVSASAGANTTADQIVQILGIDLDIDHPEQRLDHEHPIWTHGDPSITVAFTASLSTSLLDYVRTRGLRGANGGIPVYKYAVRHTSYDGTAKTVTFNGKLFRKSFRHSRGSQELTSEVTATIRVTENALPAAT